MMAEWFQQQEEPSPNAKALFKPLLSYLPFGHIPLANRPHDHTQKDSAKCCTHSFFFYHNYYTEYGGIKSKFISIIMTDIFQPSYLLGSQDTGSHAYPPERKLDNLLWKI